MPQARCKICGKNIYVKPSHQKLGWGKYCSIVCRTKSQFKGRFVECYKCGKKIYRSPARLKHSISRKYFCCKKCQTLWRNSYFIEQKHSNWSGGKSVYKDILIRSGKKQICRNCGISDVRILSVHHIDSNRNNNNLKNLVWLCFNCHFLIHHDDFFYKEYLIKLSK